MKNRGKSFLAGAAVAALLTLPAAAANGDWTVWPTKTFSGNGLKVSDVVGKITVNVRDGGPVTVDVSGTRPRVDGVSVHQEDGTVVIDGSNSGDNESVWDWHKWFNFSQDWEPATNSLNIKVTVPRGSEVNIDDLVGDATIGDTQGPLHFGAAATRARIGHVGEAHVSLGGAGHVEIAQVSGPLHLEIGGSGKVAVGPTQGAHVEIGGSGDASFGPVAGGLSVDIGGSGDVSAASVNGPTHVDIAGSGTVKIADGTANPLHVDIMGAGNFIFGGVAVDPHIDAVGSGNVKIKSYRGHLDNEGMADVKIGP